MRLFACVLVLAAACTKPGGIELDVTAISTITEVHVYIGTHDLAQSGGAYAVPQRAGSQDDMLHTDNVFSREADNGSDWLPYTPGQTLHFEFESGDRSSIGAIIVVGFGADHQPVASWIQTNLTLTPHEVDRFAIDLSGPDTNQQVFMWGPGSAVPPNTAPCAGVVTQGDDAHTGFVVTADDIDCDGYANDDTARECDPFYYDDPMAAAISSGTEVKEGSNTVGCKLYGATCTDGTGAGGGFTPTTSCLPSPACNGTCSGSVTDALACLSDPALAASDADTGYTCKIGTDTTGGDCVALVVPRPPTGGYACDSSNSGILQPDGSLAHDQVIDGIDVAFDVDDTCALTLTPDSSSPSTGSGARVLLQVGLENGTSLVLPVDLVISGDACASDATASAACTVNTPNLRDPVLTECVAGWSPPTQVTDQSGQAISGTSPALDGSMTNLFYISEHTVFAVSRASMTDPWGSATPLDLAIDFSGAVPTFLHLSRDGADLWIGAVTTSGNGGSGTTITGGGVWHVALTYPLDPATPLPGTLVSTLPDAISYAPADASPDDVAVGTSQYQLFDVVGNAQDGAPIVMGESPFFGDDAASVWFSAPQGGYLPVLPPVGPPGSDVGSDVGSGSGSGSGGSGSGGSDLQPTGPYWIYVESRTDASTPFPSLVDPSQTTGAVGPVPLVELGAASYPQGPWLSPDLHTIYFSSDGTGTTARYIYMSTR